MLQTGDLQEIPRRRAYDILNRAKPPFTRFTYAESILAVEFDGLVCNVNRYRLLQLFVDQPRPP